jgi:hypothetical protein
MHRRKWPSRSLLVTTADGATVDLEPLAAMLITTKRNTGRRHDSPQGALAASPIEVAMFELGVVAAVSELFGREAQEAFEAYVAER